ncbi:hypothetical protein QBC35DRAFT_478236 [Podospora australis]|uniref:Uncharacterized protein n=1 Tax=Podospora australis TaxID=1536484 RepID=A0AAN6WN68_9PEZI|nr:hypothetical protein QBC35DRAFT_478236 [Podospora australis]
MSFLDADDGELPPTYTEAVTSPGRPLATALTGTSTTSSNDAPSSVRLPSSITGTLTSPLTNHLRSLPARMSRAQQTRATEQASKDLDLITLLVPHIEAFLSDLGDRERIPPSAELTLVPAVALPSGWIMTGAAERRKEGEVVKVLKINFALQKTESSTPQGEKGGAPGRYEHEETYNDDGDDTESSRQKEPGFDEWGRFDCEETDSTGSDETKWLWFKDEGMARRLATYLRPEPNLERKHVQAVVVEKKEQKSLFKGWGKKKEPAPTPGLPGPLSPASPGAPPMENEDKVKMTVRAREVTFRKENDFGVWEGRSGFGIVVTVRISS